MKNGDKPANPLSGQKWQDEIGMGVASDYYKGLTKREYFAGLALSQAVAIWYNHTNEELVKRSIAIADELLKQLEE